MKQISEGKLWQRILVLIYHKVYVYFILVLNYDAVFILKFKPLVMINILSYRSFSNAVGILC